MLHYYPLAVLAITWIIWLWETYLSCRQYFVYLNTTKVPKELEKHIDTKTFDKAKAYSIDKARFGFISSFYAQLQTSVSLCFFLMPIFWKLSGDLMHNQLGLNRTGTIEWEIFQSIIFSLITTIINLIVNLPLSIYNTFVIEERHGFNKQTAKFYAWDKLKQLLVSFIISTPIMVVVIYIVHYGGPYFFLYLWMFSFVVITLLTFFSGEIMAIFDTFTDLKQGELREKIEKLAEGLNFPLANIFVVEGSKRSSHSNAYQAGIFKKKRIVLYDTLIKDYYKKEETECDADKTKSSGEDKATSESSKQARKDSDETKGFDNDEILAVVCHELGHWYHGHLLKQLVSSQINIFFMFLIFSKFYKDPTFFSAFGFSDETPVFIGLTLLTMILTPYNEIYGILSIFVSRRFEYQADNFAKGMGYAEHLKKSLIKLNVDNLGFPVHDELYSKFTHSHPTLMQRIKALGKTE